MKIVLNCSWSKPDIRAISGHMLLVNNLDTTADVVVDIDSFSKVSQCFPPEKRIYVTGEPSAFCNYTPDLVERYASYYKKGLLTWHPQLRSFPQWRLFRFGCSWVTWETKVAEKKFGIGGIFSGKNDPLLPGYALRSLIVSRQHEVITPGIVFNPTKSWKGVPHEYPQKSKQPSLEYMFHLAIENTSELGYFTEKIIDCFRTYSVPLYYGDPDIASSFDASGIISVDASNIVEKTNSLTPELYYSKMDAIIKNFEQAGLYAGFEPNLVNHVVKYWGTP